MQFVKPIYYKIVNDFEDYPYVGVLDDQTVYAYAAILAISLAGKAYVPLNPSIPAERNERIISETGIRCIFYAEKLEGPWVATKKTKNLLSRSAGHFINDWRPVQESTKTYGGAIKFLKGKKIVKSIYPTWAKNIIGTHTFNISTKYVVIDGKRSFKNRIENRRNAHSHSA